MANTRVLLVEDHPLYRMGLHLALSYSTSNCSIVEECDNVRKANTFIEEHPSEIDLILLDFFLPDGNGLEVVKAAKLRCPWAKILVISAENNNPYITSLIDAGINGFINKDITSQDLSLVIASVVQGHNYFSKEVLDIMDRNSSEKVVHSSEIDTLSNREIEIIRLCAKGLSAKEVASALNISPRTVESHKDRIFSKLNVNSTVELTNFALRAGIL